MSGDWYYFLADGLGSTMAIVDDAGAVQNSYTYDVYGEAAVTGSLQNEFDFAGQQTDGDTGLQYLRARYMDPETGVFLSRDPLAGVPGWLGSHFGYASGNPATATDPTGLCDDTRTDGCEGGDIYIRTTAPDGTKLPIGHWVGDVTQDGYQDCAWNQLYNDGFTCTWVAYDQGSLSDGLDILLDARDYALITATRFTLGEKVHRLLGKCASRSGCREAVDLLLFQKGVAIVAVPAEIQAILKILGKGAAISVFLAGQTWSAYKRQYPVE